jgi:hypothetical protein
MAEDKPSLSFAADFVPFTMFGNTMGFVIWHYLARIGVLVLFPLAACAIIARLPLPEGDFSFFLGVE